MALLSESEAQRLAVVLMNSTPPKWFSDRCLDMLIGIRHHRALWMEAYLMAKDHRCESELLHAMKERENRNRMSPLVHWTDLPDMPENPWLIDRLIRRGGMSIFAGNPKVGKSTLICFLVAAMLGGGRFIDRDSVPSRVLYYSLEEIGEEVKARFSNYLTGEEPLFVREGYVPASEFPIILEEDIAEVEADLVVIDPLFDIVDVESTNDYVPVNRAIKELLYIARQTGVHICCVHHAAKAGGILGTQSLRGGTDANLYLVKNEKNGEREFHSENRYGKALETYNVRLDEVTGYLDFQYACLDG